MDKEYTREKRWQVVLECIGGRRYSSWPQKCHSCDLCLQVFKVVYELQPSPDPKRHVACRASESHSGFWPTSSALLHWSTELCCLPLGHTSSWRPLGVGSSLRRACTLQQHLWWHILPGWCRCWTQGSSELCASLSAPPEESPLVCRPTSCHLLSLLVQVCHIFVLVCVSQSEPCRAGNYSESVNFQAPHFWRVFGKT